MNPFPVFLAAAALIAAIAPGAVAAAPGTLDPTYGGGVIRFGAAQAKDRAMAAVRTADNKVLVAAEDPNGVDLIGRLLADGTPDLTFGLRGWSIGVAAALVAQDDGKVIAVAPDYLGFRLTRHLADGNVDATFGAGGSVNTSFGTGAALAMAAAVQPDGKIVAVGRSDAGLAVARYLASGALDPAFAGGNGRVSFAMGSAWATGEGPMGLAVRILPSGKILVVGRALGNGQDLVVLQLNADGTADTGFGCASAPCAGHVLHDFGGLGDEGMAAEIVAGGNIVVGVRGIDVLRAVRLLPNGLLDTSFGSGGSTAVAEPVILGITLSALAVDGAGLIHMAGRGGLNDGHFFATRLLSNGVLDAAWGNGGKSLVATGVPETRGIAILTMAAGPILVGSQLGPRGNADIVVRPLAAGIGAATFADGESDSFPATATLSNSGGLVALANRRLVARTPSGAPDTAFGATGVHATAFDGIVEVKSATRDSLGRFLVAGPSGVGPQAPGVVQRRLANGDLDTTFGVNGSWTANPPMFYSYWDFTAIAAVADGSIFVGAVLASTGASSPDRSSIFRLTSAGVPDGTFNGGGSLELPLGTEYEQRLTDLAIDASGRIVFTAVVGDDGYLEFPPHFTTAVGRVTPAGAMDTGFGCATPGTCAGYRLVSPQSSSPAIFHRPKLAVSGDNRVISVDGDSNLVCRQLVNGMRDPAIGINGCLAIGTGVQWQQVALQQNGRIVVAGTEGSGSTRATVVRRLSPDFSSDLTFGTQGRVVVDADPAAGDAPVKLLFQADGGILVVGGIEGAIRDVFAARVTGDAPNAGIASLAISSSRNPRVYSEPTSITATVTGNAPTGTVTFSRAFVGSPTPVAGCVEVPLAGAAATCPLGSAFPDGGTVLVVYNGDAANAAAAATFEQGFTPASAVLTITGHAPHPSYPGQTVDVAVQVATAAPGTAPVTEGSVVTVTDGQASCTFSLPLSGCTIALQTAGSRMLVATLAATEFFSQSSSSPVAHSVLVAGTSTVLDSINPFVSSPGTKVNFFFRVQSQPPALGYPTGNVAVTIGGVSMGAGFLSPTATPGVSLSGNVSFTPGANGAYTVSASYPGNSTYVGSSLADFVYIVGPSATLTVAKSGNGTGSVASTAPAIPSLNCGTNCVVPYPQGAVVTLAATPSGGSMFIGWSGGGCSGQGSCQVTLSAATTVTATFAMASTAPVRSGFNGDAFSDVFWRDATGGLNYQWQMNAFAIIGQGYLPSVPAGWTPVAAGDLDGDGKSDILWREATGLMYYWSLDGLAVGAQGYLPSVPPPWIVAGVGDANGDGRADVFWRNASTGENYLWTMNGGAIATQGYLPSVAGSAWTMAGIGDFSGDGKADVFWRNTSAGDNYLWVMDGLAITAQGYLPNVPAGWEFVAHPNADGALAADVFWRNAATGANYVWLMDGFAIAGQGYLPTVGDVDWKVEGFGDYSGDGKGDILWRHAATGQMYLWVLNGLSVAAQGYLPTVAGANWQPLR